MIITKLQGGLGNQMFQYAIGKTLSEKNKTELKLDLSFYNKQPKNTTLREYSLGCFNVKKNIATDKEIKKLKKYEWKNSRRHFLYNLIFADRLIYIEEKWFDFEENYLKIKNNAYLDGYWQSEKYFSAQGGKNIEKIIQKKFTLKKDLNNIAKGTSEKIINSNSVSIHIRRGDYANNPDTKSYHGLCPIGYYEKAIKKITNKIKNPTFYIFSDDIEWVKKNLKTNFPMIFVEGNKDYEDLILMSYCKHNIIANSSFSWWGAWLNKNPNKIVIAPKKWFVNETKNTNNLIPKPWIQL